MQWDLTRQALQAARRTWLHLGGPRPSEIEAETRKNRCWKATRFWDLFLKGSDIVFQGFLVGCLDQNCIQKVINWIVWKVNKTLRGRTFFWCWLLQQASKFVPKSMTNRMFRGTSILIRFGENFGKGLGSQNRRFSHAFPCFFDVIFQARLERRKNRPRWANKTQKAQICSWAPVIPRPVGKGKDRGKNTSGRIARKNV